MADPFLGEIRPVPYNFAPQGWAFCNGQILPISQNQALFSLLGTTYGGNGQTTFALPDLRGRVPLGAGNGPGLQPHQLGEVAGSETGILIGLNLPSHNHAVNVAVQPADKYDPGQLLPAVAPRQLYAPNANSAFAADSLGNAGGNQPHENRQPFLTIGYIIALQGIFPPRN